VVDVVVEILDKLNSLDLMDLCDATESTMLDTYGFSVGAKQWQPPLRSDLENYFKGVMLVQERKLIVARIDGTIAGSIQVVLPAVSNQTSDFAVNIDNHFVAPWSRNLGISKQMLRFVEKYTLSSGYTMIKLSVRSNREAAINLYESFGYKRWGVLEKYEKIGSQMISGFFYCKDLDVARANNRHGLSADSIASGV